MRGASTRGVSMRRGTGGSCAIRFRRNRHAEAGEEAHPVHGARAELPPVVATRHRQVRDGLSGGGEAGLPCRSLLGTQIAPEDVSGIPRIVGERSVFCPPRVLLPERPSRSACSSMSCQPARRTCRRRSTRCCSSAGSASTRCPRAPGWSPPAIALQDRALVRAMSSALVNRVAILHLRVDTDEWLAWAPATASARDPQLHRQHARRP